MGKRLIGIVLGLMLFGGVAGCNGKGLNPQKPVTVIMWHHYGGQMQAVMDALVDEFNSTIGREKGILISVTSISATKDIQEKLSMIMAGDPGAPELPDMVTAYPKTALLLAGQGLLAPLNDQFTQRELNQYIPQFIEEGVLPDGRLYVFPIAKSTEVLFVNQTLFQRFSAATGVDLESLRTFEGIAAAAVRYYQWTDSLTPNQANDGKTFFTSDSWFNMAQVGMAQLGGKLVGSGSLNLRSKPFRRIWDVVVPPALTGGYAVTNGYSSELSRTGEIVCSTGSTAGILFYGDTVTYPDNRTETVTYTVLPFPTFEGGRKIALQRGAGMCITRSSPQKEYAAALFLKWFTRPQQNMRFVASTGYLPVTRDAFEKNMASEIRTAQNKNLKKLFEAAIQMYKEYTFLIPPNHEDYEKLSREFETQLKQSMLDGRVRALKGYQSLPNLSEGLFEAFITR